MRKGRLVELLVCACLAILAPAAAAERPSVITGKLEAPPAIDGEIGETEWSGATVIDKLNVQAVWVWRFIPPFGSVQVAYQCGTSEIGKVSDQGNTFFTKLSWVF